MICERDGYIPKSYVESPRDKVDRVIEDNQRYTYNLVTEEMGLGNLIENAIKQMEEEKQNILRAGDDAGDEDEEYAEEERLFDYETNDFETLSSQDFQDFYSLEEEDIVEDQGYLESLATANTEGSGD
jgi:hypothetical protein